MEMPTSDVYWPTGWSRERLVHATSAEMRTLSLPEQERMFDSIRAAMSDEDRDALFNEMSKYEKAREAEEKAAIERSIAYPPGWSRQRLLDASSDEINTISSAESERMWESIKDALGDNGLEELKKEIEGNQRVREIQANLDAGVPMQWHVWDRLPPLSYFGLARTLAKRYPEGPYGWIVYRTCCYDDDAKWEAFRRKWDQFIDSEFQQSIHLLGAKETKARFEIRWMEDEKFARLSHKEIAAHYKQWKATLPIPGMHLGLCLVVGESELQSVLESPFPIPQPIHEQLLIPYVTGVVTAATPDTAWDHFAWEEPNWGASYKIALSALVNELDTILLENMRSPLELSAGLQDDDVFLSWAGRWGRFKLGVSQGDEHFVGRRGFIPRA